MREYYRLTKPGIVYGNALPAIAGFLLAANGRVYPSLFLAMLAGLSLIIASACVINNYIDRDIDRRMARTRQRALASGAISCRSALIFATVLGMLGVVLLAWFTNRLTLVLALFGLFAYLVLYGIGKRVTVHGTLIGSISGAIPPVVGYAAVTNHLDTASLLLFLSLIFWQMPHFYAIAIFRAKDYRAADIPVLPVVASAKITKIQILAYTVAFLISTSLLTVYGYTGYIYLIGMLLISLIWVARGLQGFKAADNDQWSRQMFGFSLIALLAWCLLTGLAHWLP